MHPLCISLKYLSLAWVHKRNFTDFNRLLLICISRSGGRIRPYIFITNQQSLFAKNLIPDKMHCKMFMFICISLKVHSITDVCHVAKLGGKNNNNNPVKNPIMILKQNYKYNDNYIYCLSVICHNSAFLRWCVMIQCTGVFHPRVGCISVVSEGIIA